MRDLYNLLHIPSTSNESSIRRAIEQSRLSQTDRDDIAYVLLNQSRRTTYDKYRRDLIQVLKVRARANIQSTDNLFASGIDPDFAKSFYSNRNNNNSSVAIKNSNDTSPLSGCLAIAVLAVILFGIIFAISSNNQNTTGYTPSNSRPSPQRTYTPPTPPTQSQSRPDTYLEFALKHFPDQDGSDDRATRAASRMRDGKSDPLPQTGVLSREDDWMNYVFGNQIDGYSPIEIKTPRGSNYFIKVLDWNTSSTVLTAFIRSGETFETMLPIGVYEIRYASGQKWYGKPLLFGPNASYARCDDRFHFTATYGHTIELIKQLGGNLETENLSEDEF